MELLETRHVRKAFEAMPVKSDRNDARGIAQLMRLGWFRPVHCKSMAAQETRAVLTARKLVQSKLKDVENSLRGILRGFGLKVGKTTARSFAGRIRELVEGQANLETIAQALLAVHAVLLREFNGFEKRVRMMAREHVKATLLMTTLVVGPIVAPPMPAPSTTLRGSNPPRMQARISGSPPKNTNPARPTTLAGSARSATVRYAWRSMRPPTSC